MPKDIKAKLQKQICKKPNIAWKKEELSVSAAIGDDREMIEEIYKDGF